MSGAEAEGLVVDLESTSLMPKIRTRSDLIHALTEAAELEHGLMVQYLFAAFSMRKGPQEGLSIAQVELIRRWEATILRVAMEEMAHLGTVCNLLTAVGGAPHFRRPNLPAPGRYYPHEGNYQSFTLQPFSLATVERFIRFEQPPRRGLVELDLKYPTIGRLYHIIRTGFVSLDRSGGLFVGRHDDQDSDDWSAALRLHGVTDLRSACRAVDFIVEEGEGTRSDQASHWRSFRKIRDELLAAQQADPGFQPARPVRPNPLTRRHGAAGPGTEVDDPHTKQVSELFNWVYATVLIMLMQHYGGVDQHEKRRDELRATIRRMMSGVVRPLGEVLTELPAQRGAAEPTAGPSFELYADLRLPAQSAMAWTLFSERLDQAVDECCRLARLGPPRLKLIHVHLQLAAREVDRLRPGA